MLVATNAVLNGNDSSSTEAAILSPLMMEGTAEVAKDSDSSRGRVMKVVTLRRNSPQGVGNHVVSIVTSASTGEQADELAIQVASCAQQNRGTEEATTKEAKQEDGASGIRSWLSGWFSL